MRPSEISESERVIVRQVRSAIGTKPKHRGTLRALGLGRIGSSNTLPNRPEIQGMIARVRHLVTVEGVGATSDSSAGEPSIDMSTTQKRVSG